MNRSKHGPIWSKLWPMKEILEMMKIMKNRRKSVFREFCWDYPTVFIYKIFPAGKINKPRTKISNSFQSPKIFIQISVRKSVEPDAVGTIMVFIYFFVAKIDFLVILRVWPSGRFSLDRKFSLTRKLINSERKFRTAKKRKIL